ncbi:hypothetical protein IGS59_17240 [Janthinobacterium sp. GW460P]|uniref:hypothetical protein n=1 Tax=unclassified Janthinobacterium TaxID=2610881 RepID=UPI000A323E28|nr:MULTISPECIES: hypothetical protein [unclassified Janthinobacterium]MCC7703983.1 hypothetical protein [Janthinobacterium sp. GW460P]MCC7709490.1 hypothetical protein [Janthinobacterium sp. GW460W]
MALETTAAGGALIKLFGVPVLAGAAATSLGFMFMWPQSTKEAFIRFCSSIIISTFLGPLLVAAVLSWWPSLFDSAKTVAGLYGGDPATGFLFIAAPLMVAAGLPAWWVLGASVRWFDKRRGKDIGELAVDAAAVVKDVRGVL